MKKIILTLTVMIVISMLLWGVETSYAMVTGVCSGCHTMHNSEDGVDLNPEPTGKLLVDDCVGCHSHDSETQSYTLGSSTVPVVNYTGGVPPGTYLAGGNFYWVADGGDGDDAKGHNVLGISTEDAVLNQTVGAPGNEYGCEVGGCHGSLAVANILVSDLGSGCQGCHLNVQHHADDGTGTKYVDSADQGWYRFLSGHMTAATSGVKGIEDIDWQSTVDFDNHNEYLGVPADKTGANSLANSSMTAFCCGCHGNFHVQNEAAATDPGSQSPWLRHPSDFVIPDSGEYSGISTIYDPLTPVARPEGFVWDSDTPSGIVTPGTDIVMCLSCHRPHGSPHDDLLRWDYNEMEAGVVGSLENRGCFYCHVTKDT